MDNQRKFIIRSITADDDAAIAVIIRDNLRAAHLDIPGTAYFDPELDHLSDFYNAEPQRRRYYIATDENSTVIGGVGYAEFPGVENCAELQKLYLDDTVKGRGYSHELHVSRRARRKSSRLQKNLSRNPHQPADCHRPLRKTRLQKHPPARANHPHNDGSVLYQGAVRTRRENGTHHTEKICVMRTIFLR